MSKQIDERVVSMQFDNRNFEKNVSTTLSTLDKLKQKLNFTGSAKGLENIGTATKNIKMDGLAKGVETVRAKFSALEVMGVTALANIANSAVNAGKRMVKALTIDPVMDGFREYEMMLNTIQTTMAATGLTAKEVEKELEKLDIYADKTVYSTADMMNNLPKFTNAGVELSKAITAMIGIANATALAGGDASKASIAFYNLGQAIGTGYLTRMDYNSINNAGIATMEWKNQMVEAAIAAGTLKKAGDDLYKAGNSKKAFTLQQLFIDGLQEQWATTEVMMKVFGDYGDETTEIGKKSYSAAQDIKTFTMMMESLKASVGTGWKDTWQLIFGDLDGAKALWSGVYKFISKITDGMTKFRNTILESAFTKGFTNLVDKVNSVTKPLNKAVDAIKDYKKVVNEIIRGDWGNGQSRWDKLTKAGYDWAHAQNLVNEKLGVSLRRQTKYKEGQAETAKSTEKLTEKEADRIAQLATLSEAELKSLGYTDKQIQAFRELAKAADQVGLPLEEFLLKIDEIDGRWLFLNSFKNIGEAMSQFASVIGQAWKEIFPNSMDSIANAIFNIISAFHKFTTGLGGFIDESGKLTESGENLKRTFEGIFAAIDIVATLASGPLGLAFRILKEVLEAIDIPILEFTAKLGDAIVAVRDWLDSVLNISGVADKIAPYIKKVIDYIKDLGSAFKNSKFYEVGKNIISGLANGIKNGAKTVWDAIVGVAKGLVEKICSFLGIESPSKVMTAIGGFIIAGLVAGIIDNSGVLLDGIKNLCANIVNAFQGIDLSNFVMFLSSLGTFLPNTKIFKWVPALINMARSLGSNMLDSFKNGLGVAKSGANKARDTAVEFGTNVGEGLKSTFQNIISFIKDFGGKVADAVKSIDFGAVFAGGIAVAALVLLNKMLNIVDKFSGIGGFFDTLGEGINKNLKASALEHKAKALLNLAIAIGILAGSFIVLTSFIIQNKQEWPAMLAAVGALAVLAGILIGLAWAANKFSAATVSLTKDGGFQRTASAAASLMAVALSLVLVAAAVKLISTIELEKVGSTIGIMATMLIGMISLMGLMAWFNKRDLSGSLSGAGAMMLKMSAALLIMVVVIKMVSKLKADDVAKGLAFVAAVELLFIAVVAVSKFAGQHAAKAGTMLLLMSLAFVIMVRVVKQAAKLENGTVSKAMGVLASVGVLFAAIIAVSRLAGENAVKAGAMLLLMAGALWIMVHTIELIAGVDDVTIDRSLTVITRIGLIFTALMGVSRLAGANAAKAGAMLISASGALLILVGAMFLLSYMLKNNEEGVNKALGVVALLEILFAGLIAVSKLAENSKASLITLTIMIALIMGVVIGLTFIKDGEKLKQSVAAVSAILVAFAILIAATSKMGSPKIGSLVGLIAIVGLLGLVVWGISKLQVGNCLDIVKSITILLVAMAASLAILGMMKSPSSKAVLALAGMGLVVAELAIILKAISHFDITVSMDTVLALSTLLLALSAAVAILSALGPATMFATTGVKALVLLIAALGVVIGGLGALDELFNGKLEKFIDKGLPLLEKLGLGLGKFFGNIIGGLLGGIAGGTIAAYGKDLSNFMTNIEPFLEGCKNIDGDMLDSVKIIADLSKLKFSKSKNSLAEFGNDLVEFAPCLASFAEIVSVLDDGHLNAMHIAAKAGKALAETAAAIPKSGGLWGAIAGNNDFSSFGPQIEAFGKSLVAFGKSVQGIDQYENAINASIAATKGIVEVADAIPNSGGLWAKIAGDNTMDGFGTQVEAFGKSLIAYGKSVQGVDQYEKAIKSSVKAVEGLVEVANEIPTSGGWFGKIFGDDSIGGFGAQLTTFGNGLKSYGVSVSGIDGYAENITKSKDVVSVLVEIANKIRDELDFDWGESEITKVGSGFTALGQGIASFSTASANIGDINTLKTVVTETVDLANYVKDNLVWDAGEAEITKLGADLASFGLNLASYSNNVRAAGDISAIKQTVETLVNSVNYVKDNLIWDAGQAEIKKMGDDIASFGNDISTFGKGLAEMGDISAATATVDTLINMVNKVKNAFPKNDASESGLSAFGSQVEKFGKKLKTFGTNLAKAGDVSSAVSTVETIITMANKVKDGFGSDSESLKNAGDGIKDFGKALGKFAKEVKDVKVGDMSTIGASINSIVKATEKLNNLNVSGLKNFGSTLSKLGKTGVKSLTDEFKKVEKSVDDIMKKAVKAIKSYNPNFKTEGKNSITELVKGITGKNSDVKKAAINSAKTAVTAIRSYYSKFKSAGSYVVDGFAAGISANTFKAKAKAKAMAEAALEAAREVLRINSPSKAFRDLGLSVPEGFALGISKMANAVKSASVGMSNVALNSVKSSISRISNIINSDIDAQPTIRPVVDLSDVTASANSISGLFDMNPSIGVMANARSINTMMSRNQNGSNSEVVSAINELKKSMGKTSGDTYNINGVTYDDGSNITEAVSTLIRAARIERRT